MQNYLYVRLKFILEGYCFVPGIVKFILPAIKLQLKNPAPLILNYFFTLSLIKFILKKNENFL
jgi:hypothetical protein